MNGERLYINGQQVKLFDKKSFAYTLQVNDIASVTNRQSSFTKTIEIPKTPENVKLFNYLGYAGNTSILPYQKNEINYYIDNDCIIYNGWGILNETDDNYKLHIYDGVIDLFKSIENKTLADLNITDLNHEKNLSNVIASWNDANGLNYKYIVADYNGKAKYDSGNKFNIDYLIPSVKVSYLMDKIFDFAGMTYSGNTFSTADYQDLYMTYPKGILTVVETDPILESGSFNFLANPGGTVNRRSVTFSSYSAPVASATTLINNVHVQVNQTGNYRIKISGMFKYRYQPTVTCSTKLNLAYNYDPNPNPDSVGLSVATDISGWLPYGTPFSYNIVKSLNSGDTFCFVLNSNYPMYTDDGCSLNFELTKLDNSEVDFADAFSQFKVTDFLKEINWRYGLTIFKDKFQQNYNFLTLNERINTSEVVDWSNKYQSNKTEKYIYDEYGQRNILHHKYNDENNSHNDGFISLINKNLSDEKKIIESKIYSPEKDLNKLDFPFESHIYKLWNKEVTENDGTQEVKYKALDKRFYFLKAKNYTFSSPVTIGSESLITATTVSSAVTESYDGVAYNEVAVNYYNDLGDILNNCKIITSKFNLNHTDISQFDFKKKYHIDQLGGQFLVNKINNWQHNKLVDVELIKVNNNIPRPIISGTPTGLYITITGVTFTNVNTWTRNINIHYVTNVTDTYLTPVYVNNDTYTFPAFINTSPYVFFDMITPSPTGFTSLTLTSFDGTIVSNSVQWWG